MKSSLKHLLFFSLIFAVCSFCGSNTTWAKVPGGDSRSPSGISISGKTCLMYCLGGGTNNPKNRMYVSPGETMKLSRPYRNGFYFRGWFLDKEFKYPVSQIEYYGDLPIIIYAKWSMVLNNKASVMNYNYTVQKTLKSKTVYLKDCDFSFLEEVLIPGMPSTREDAWYNSFIYSQSQCPQGLCFTDDFILITSYSEGTKHLGELMVINRETGKYMFTLGMDPKSHLGGIAFDGENVWVCNSEKQTLERISYDFIRQMARENEGNVVDASGMVDEYSVSNTPSCITFHENRLWVATHTKVLESKMKAYYYDRKRDELKALSAYNIPAQVQGVAFDEDGSIYLSTSYGRSLSSYIKKYNSLVEMSANTKKPSRVVEMPPESEEIEIVDGVLHCIFESAGEKYYDGTDGNGRSLSPIDKILKIKLDSL